MNFYSEILKQLGGKRFIIMTGAKNLTYDDKSKSIAFKIMRNAKKITHVKIILNGLDLYDMIFYNCGKELKTISQVKNLYCEMIRGEFEKQTGLYTSL